MAGIALWVCGQIVAKTPQIVVLQQPKPTWHYLVDVAQVVGAVGAVVAIVFAIFGLRHSRAAQEEVARGRREERLERRLEALQELFYYLEEADRHARWTQPGLPSDRSRIRAILAANQSLRGKLPLTEAAGNLDLDPETATQSAPECIQSVSGRAQQAMAEVKALIEKEAKVHEELTRFRARSSIWFTLTAIGLIR